MERKPPSLLSEGPDAPSRPRIRGNDGPGIAPCTGPFHERGCRLEAVRRGRKYPPDLTKRGRGSQLGLASVGLFKTWANLIKRGAPGTAPTEDGLTPWRRTSLSCGPAAKARHHVRLQTASQIPSPLCRRRSQGSQRSESGRPDRSYRLDNGPWVLAFDEAGALQNSLSPMGADGGAVIPTVCCSGKLL